VLLRLVARRLTWLILPHVRAMCVDLMSIVCGLGSGLPSLQAAFLMSLTGLVVLLFIVAAFGVLGAAVFWLALKNEDNRGRQD
jgi:hypothetical protein